MNAFEWWFLGLLSGVLLVWACRAGAVPPDAAAAAGVTFLDAQPWTGYIECEICGHGWQATIPAAGRDRPQDCPNCGCCAARPPAVNP